MLVLVNPAAHGGTGLSRWHELLPRALDLVGPFALVEAVDPCDVRAAVAEALARGETRFVAVGGDGMVNLVMSSLVAQAEPATLGRITLGAIGLGSSNDFHKPFTPQHRFGRAPYRLDFDRAQPHDVGRLRYEDCGGDLRERFWIVNASVGTTAEGNYLFNNPDRFLRWLKRISSAAAMTWAAVRSVLRYVPPEISLTLDSAEQLRCRLRNLGVVKNPHFTGALCYDSPHEPASGRFFVHLLEDVTLPSLVLTLLALARGRFSGRPGARTWRAARAAVTAPTPFAVEADGEVFSARRAEFSLLPGALRVCA
ncbi:MAG: diacylglycerol/lipid kinase family protein [Gemmatimonadales bacterium]